MAGESEGGASRLARFAEDPRRWRAEASDLRAACRVLRDYWLAAQPGEATRSEVAFPALLLAGYAIENYSKARLIRQGKTWKPRRGHDLPWLVNEAGIELDESDELLIRRLKQIVTWAGRYPAPLNPRDFSVPLGDEWPLQVRDSDFKAIEKICERLDRTSEDEADRVDAIDV